jgi:hypothetical protein
MIAGPTAADPETLAQLAESGYPEMRDRFNPHVTVAAPSDASHAVDLSDLWSTPAEFSGELTTIAVYGMGPYGTCLTDYGRFTLGADIGEPPRLDDLGRFDRPEQWIEQFEARIEGAWGDFLVLVEDRQPSADGFILRFGVYRRTGDLPVRIGTAVRSTVRTPAGRLRFDRLSTDVSGIEAAFVATLEPWLAQQSGPPSTPADIPQPESGAQ